MEFIEYSLASLCREATRLANLVREDGYRPDCVAYLARGGWVIGEVVANYFSIPIIELSVQRSGSLMKEKSSGLLRRLPRSLRKALREREVAVRLFSGQADGLRHEALRLTSRYSVPSGILRVLLVDDSADTGHSMAVALEELSLIFPDAEIRTAVINAFAIAEDNVHIDWRLCENCLLGTPSSKDNREYDKFIKLYNNHNASCLYELAQVSNGGE